MPPLKLKIFGTKKFLYCRAEDVLIKKSVLERGNSFFMIYCIYLNNEFTCPAPILTSRYTTPSRRNSPNDHSNINLTLRNVIPHHRMRRKCWWQWYYRWLKMRGFHGECALIIQRGASGFLSRRPSLLPVSIFPVCQHSKSKFKWSIHNVLQFNFIQFQDFFVNFLLLDSPDFDQAIEEICGKSTWRGNYLTLAAHAITFSKIDRKPFFRIWSGKMYIPNFSYGSFFFLVRGCDTNRHTDI